MAGMLAHNYLLCALLNECLSACGAADPGAAGHHSVVSPWHDASPLGKSQQAFQQHSARPNNHAVEGQVLQTVGGRDVQRQQRRPLGRADAAVVRAAALEAHICYAVEQNDTTIHTAGDEGAGRNNYALQEKSKKSLSLYINTMQRAVYHKQRMGIHGLLAPIHVGVRPMHAVYTKVETRAVTAAAAVVFC